MPLVRQRLEGGNHNELPAHLEELAQLAAGIGCLLYTSDAADERSSVDLGGRRIIKKKNRTLDVGARMHQKNYQARTDVRNVRMK